MLPVSWFPFSKAVSKVLAVHANVCLSEGPNCSRSPGPRALRAKRKEQATELAAENELLSVSAVNLCFAIRRAVPVLENASPRRSSCECSRRSDQASRHVNNICGSCCVSLLSQASAWSTLETCETGIQVTYRKVGMLALWGRLWFRSTSHKTRIACSSLICFGRNNITHSMSPVSTPNTCSLSFSCDGKQSQFDVEC